MRLSSAMVEDWTRRVACFVSIAFVLVFVYVAMRRMVYPFELDRMESGMMTSVWRLRHGLSLYSAPSVDWAPFLYAPLFFELSAWLTRLTGVGYSTLRVVSIVSTLGSFAVVYGLVYRETRRHSAALTSVGLYACLYSFCLDWYDIGRVDSLATFLFLAALYATRWTHPLIAAGLWLLAFHSKQNFLPFGVVAFLPLWRRPGRMWTGIVAFVAGAAVSIEMLNHASAGWYARYVFGTAGQIKFSTRQALLFLPRDVIGALPVVVVLLLAAVLVAPPRLRSDATAFYGFLTLMLFGAVGFVRAHEGANLNAMIPLYMWLAVLAGLALHRILGWLESTGGGVSAQHAQMAASVLWMGLAAQMIGHIYQPGGVIPRASELRYRTELLNAVRATPGDVWVVNHSYDGILAGKPVHAEMDALDAVLGKPYPPTVAEFNRMIGERHFSAVLMDRAAVSYMPPGIFTSASFLAGYGLKASAPGSGQPGLLDQPMYSYLPCDVQQQARVALLYPGVMVDASKCVGAGLDGRANH